MHRAGQLRKKPSLAEARLWAHLRGSQLRGVDFRRQHAIGKFIVDFCAPRHHLVIELDGSQHLATTAGDARRSAELQALGYRVIRFWNAQVMDDISGVMATILDALKLA